MIYWEEGVARLGLKKIDFLFKSRVCRRYGRWKTRKDNI